MDEPMRWPLRNRRYTAFLTATACALWTARGDAQAAPDAPDAAPAEEATVAEEGSVEQTPSATATAEVPTDVSTAPPAPTQVAAPPPPPAPVEAPSAAPAPWAPVFTGSYFTRYEMRANYDDMGVSRARFLEGDAAFFRLRMGIGLGLIDVGNDLKVALQFTPQATGVMGAMGPNTVADASLGLHEGYLRVQGKYMRVDTGRFELNYGDSLVVGSLDWHELGRSFDGARARIAAQPNSAWLDLFVTMVDEGRDPALVGPAARGMGFGDGDIYFYGAYAAIGPALAPGLDLDLYALGRGFHRQRGLRVDPADPTAGTYTRENANEFTFGARVKQKIKFLDYRFEGGLQTGSRPGAAPSAAMMPPASTQPAVDVFAYHADAEIGVNMASDRLRIGLEGIYASGDDPTTTDKNEGWDELYPTAHKFLGLADVFHQRGMKRTNVMSGVAHLTVKPTKSLAVQADAHLFGRPEDLGGHTGRAGGEIDVGAVYTMAKNLKLRGLYAVFLPDKDFYPVAPVGGPIDPIHYLEIELRYDLTP